MEITTEVLDELRAFPVGYQIKRIRCMFGYSQMRLAKEIGCTQTLISKWETESNLPNGINLEKIIKIFDLPNDFFANIEIQRVKLSKERKKQ